ncbi:MAG TPA: hypothetical protein VJ385_09005 [Fibrobacteria bacterium]|nr:hypothetical protein [Fibrobacteria bacterium]
MTEPDYRGSVEQTLRDFLNTCMVLAAPDQALSEGEALSVLKALFETVLPFEHPKFPISSEKAAGRFAGLFHRKPEWRDALRRSLGVFNGTGAFARAGVAALAEERRVLETYPANTPEMVQKQLDQKRGRDEKLLAFFLKKRGIAARPFTELEPAARKEYFWVWSQSGFTLKRRFHREARAALMAVAYSAPEFGKR